MPPRVCFFGNFPLNFALSSSESRPFAGAQWVIADAHLAQALPLPPEGAPPPAAGARLPRLAAPWADDLPHLAALLRHMRVQAWHELGDDAPLTPAEHALALALGLPGAAEQPACIAWAALEARAGGVPCAWLTPCEWRLGMDRALLGDPAALQLSAAHAGQLRDLIAPLLAELGIRLLDDPAPPPAPAPLRWLAQGEALRHVPTCTVARAVGRRLTPRLLPRAPAPLMRLQSEIQMLLQEHPINHERQAAGLPAVNALWLSGAGALPADFVWPAVDSVRVLTHLQTLPPHASADAARAAWQAVDAACAPLRQQPGARLVLCSAHGHLTLAATAGGLRGWLARWLRAPGSAPGR